MRILSENAPHALFPRNTYPARALDEEESIGALEVVKEASFLVAEESLFELNRERVSASHPRAIIYEGKVWKKKEPIGELVRMMQKRGREI